MKQVPRSFSTALSRSERCLLDLEGVDFLAVAAYKWLLCPRGLAFLHVNPARLADIDPWHAGWKNAADGGYYGQPRALAADARRLDVSLPWLLAEAAIPSLELISGLGVEAIAAHDLGLARRFCQGLGLPTTGSAIVRVETQDADTVAARLESARIRCAVRAGSVRVAFHLYNDEADVDRALEVLRTRTRGGSPDLESSGFSPQSRYPPQR